MNGNDHMTGKWIEGELQNVASDAGKAMVTRIPLKTEGEILVRSLTMTAHRAKSRIVGFIHDDFILIKEPVININDRFLAVFDDVFECCYFNEGYQYTFISRYRCHALREIVCIEYPRDVNIYQVRKHRRIKVNIGTKFAILGVPHWLSGDMADISKGGCRLIVKSKVRVTKGMRILMMFNLPNETLVDELRAVVLRSRYIKDGETVEVGLSFTGPNGELAKISNFCDLCMSFDLG
jgi:c-di-GMP-binding flagellar brake protein YcgR